jgi:hypothetical protein
MGSGNHKFYIQFSRLLRLQSFRITLYFSLLYVLELEFKNVQSITVRSLPIGDTSLTHFMKLAAHSTKPPTPTTMVQGDSSFTARTINPCCVFVGMITLIQCCFIFISKHRKQLYRIIVFPHKITL